MMRRARTTVPSHSPLSDSDTDEDSDNDKLPDITKCKAMDIWMDNGFRQEYI